MSLHLMHKIWTNYNNDTHNNSEGVQEIKKLSEIQIISEFDDKLSFYFHLITMYFFTIL
jgi:hypothetical protein